MEDRGASSVDDQVTDWLPTHGPVEAVGSLARLDGGQKRAAAGLTIASTTEPASAIPTAAASAREFLYNGVSSGITMVVEDGARGGVLTPPQSKSDMDAVFRKPQFSKSRGRKLGSSDEDCAPDELTYYGNRDTGSEFGSLSSLDGEIPKEVERRLPPPFSAGYDRVLMRERDGYSPPALDSSFKLSTQLAMPVARKLSPDFEALSLDDRLEMVEWALQVIRTGRRNIDDFWRSATENKSCDITDPLDSSINSQSRDLFTSEVSFWSSFDDEISTEIERRLPPPFSSGYDRILMQESAACSSSALPLYQEYSLWYADPLRLLDEEIPDEIQMCLLLPLIREVRSSTALELSLSQDDCLCSKDSNSGAESLSLLDEDIPDEIQKYLLLPLSTAYNRVCSPTAPDLPDFQRYLDAGLQVEINSPRFVTADQFHSATTDDDHSVKCLFSGKRGGNNQLQDRSDPSPRNRKLYLFGKNLCVKDSGFLRKSEQVRQRFPRKVRKKLSTEKFTRKVRKKSCMEKFTRKVR